MNSPNSKISFKTGGLTRLMRLHKEGESFLSLFDSPNVAGQAGRLKFKVKTQKVFILLPFSNGENFCLKACLCTVLKKSPVHKIKKSI